MWRGYAPAVSSALLFLSIALAPHHVEPAISADAEGGASGSRLLITEFYPCALSGDEYFALSNGCQDPVDLANCSITDGEGTLTLQGEAWLAPHRSLYVSMNSTSFESAFGRSPDIAIDDPSCRLIRTGSFRLADGGDSLALLSSTGAQLDFVKYGSCADLSPGWSGAPLPALRQGEVARRVHDQDGWQDSDSSGDWSPFREYRYGYTEFEPLKTVVPSGDMVAFTSPDCSLDVVLEVLGSAERTVRLCSYELSSAAVCCELVKASARGVDVRVLVDGAPTGGMSPRQVVCLSALTSSGMDVRILNGNLSNKVVQHFGPLHSKYAVVDSSRCLVLSENFVESGVPEDRVTANRGWGVSITSREVGNYLSAIFESDSRSSRPDVSPWRADPRYSPPSIMPNRTGTNHSWGALKPMRTPSDVTVTLFPSPDASELAPFISPFLRGSRSMIVEQFQVDLYWEGRWSPHPATSPLLVAMADAMRDGSVVRMLVDSSWFNTEGNQPALKYLSGISQNCSLRGEFRLMDPRNPITVVHNKGAVFDGRRTLVSSNNWGFSSFAKNREMAVIIDSEQVGAYFTRAFEMDWSPDATLPRAEAGENMTVHLGDVVELNGSRSVDDRGIAYYGWDIDCDGQDEVRATHASLTPEHTGTLRIRLTVEDAWGNKAMDTIAIEVIPPRDRGVSDGSGFENRYWVGVLTASLGAVAGAMLARRRLRRAGKINHHRDA